MQKRQALAIARSYRLLNIQLYRSGFYDFLYKNIIRLILSIGVLLTALYAIQHYLVDINGLVHSSIGEVNAVLVFGTYYISQALLGFLPSNIFIVWVQSFQHPAAMLLVLALLSYAGGLTAYLIGFYSGRHRLVRKLIVDRYFGFAEKTSSWGWRLVFAAALLPLPFSLVSISSGVVRMPIHVYLLWSLARIPKFFAMALLLNVVV